MKIISGGQAGVDRGGLLAALEIDLAVGGYCPRGRRAEDGRIPELFSFLLETPSHRYEQRTEWNVRESDATLLLHDGAMGPGSKATKAFCARHSKSICVIDMRDRVAQRIAYDWYRELVFTDVWDSRVLNVAGPRESTNPGIQEKSRVFCVQLFRAIMAR